MKRKLLTLALCAALVLCALPMAVSAEGNVAKIGDKEYATLQAAVDAVPADNTQTTITLLDNASGNGVRVKDGQNIIFDLASYTYNIDGTTVGSPSTETNGFQLLKGSTVAFRSGTITSDKAKILIQNYCNLTLTDVHLDGKNLVGDSPYVLSNNNGSAQLIGKTSITAPDGGVAFDMYYWPKGGYPDGVTVTVNTTGTITGKIEYTRDETTTDQIAAEKNKLTIVNVKHEGTFNVPVSGANITVSGGTFSQEVPADFLANGFAPTLNPDTNKYEITKLPVVATVDDTDYYSLAEAVAALANAKNKTLTLKADATLDSMLTISTPGVVIDLGGKTISASANFPQDSDNNKNHLVDITASNVRMYNGTLKAGATNNHTLNVWNAENVFLSNLTLDNAASYGGAPLIVGASSVTVGEKLNVVTGANSWYGINVDSRNVNGTKVGALLNVSDTADIFFSGQAPRYNWGIYVESSQGVTSTVGFSEGAAVNSGIDGLILVAANSNAGVNSVVGAENAGLQGNGDGTFGLKPAPTPAPTPKPEEPWTPGPTATPAPAPVLDSTPKTGAVSLVALPLAALALAGVGVALRKRR